MELFELHKLCSVESDGEITVCKATTFWDVTPYSLVERQQYLAGDKDTSSSFVRNFAGGVVYVWVFVMCGCFVNMCNYIYCVFVLFVLRFVLFSLCIFILICFVCTGVRTAVMSDNYIAVNNNNNNFIPSYTASHPPSL
jgi:hypothetical protein